MLENILLHLILHLNCDNVLGFFFASVALRNISSVVFTVKFI